jgi:LAO/AO transport system kinase
VNSIESISRKVIEGDVRAIAKAISLVENDDYASDALLESVVTATKNDAYVVGVTGAPGTGKSTIVDCLIEHLRRLDNKVAVVAFDPSSPKSGGAILGDRVRMQRHAGDSGVFIRSVSVRGHLGGVSIHARRILRLLEGAGFDVVLIETVGVGQSEVSIVKLADTVCLVLSPELGDSVQTIKAGVMEIADIFVLNKADMPDTEKAYTDLKSYLSLAQYNGWKPKIIKTVATSCEGIADLWNALMAHSGYTKGRMQHAEFMKNLEDEVVDIVSYWVKLHVQNSLKLPEVQQMVERAKNASVDAYEIARYIYKHILNQP